MNTSILDLRYRTSTASENSMPLATGNAKHFKAVKELEVKVFSP